MRTTFARAVVGAALLVALGGCGLFEDDEVVVEDGYGLDLSQRADGKAEFVAAANAACLPHQEAVHVAGYAFQDRAAQVAAMTGQRDGARAQQAALRDLVAPEGDEVTVGWITGTYDPFVAAMDAGIAAGGFADPTAFDDWIGDVSAAISVHDTAADEYGLDECLLFAGEVTRR